MSEILYQSGFDTPATPVWFNVVGDTYQVEPLASERDASGNGYLVAQGPWWIDGNHAPPGAGFLNLIAVAYLGYWTPVGIGDTDPVDLRNAEVTLRLRAEDLSLPEDAHLYFWFQSFDPHAVGGAGRLVNYVNVSQPIDEALVAGEWTDVTISFGSVDTDWLALGANAFRGDTYGKSTSVAAAMSAYPTDLGLILLTGDHPIQVTGRILLDSIGITLSSDNPGDAAPATNVYGTAGDDVLQGTLADDVIEGYAGDDVVYADYGRDLLNGGAGDDTLFASSREDTLDGGTGADFMVGGFGDDIYLVDDFGDQVIELSDQGFDRVLATASFRVAAGNEIEVLAADYTDGVGISLTGHEMRNILIGGAGDDTLDGAADYDTLAGMDGDDWYWVDHQGDVAREEPGAGVDRVFASVTYALQPGSEIETSSTDWNAGTAPISLVGNELSNFLIGNAGSNVLKGNAGKDYLYGLGGDDFYVLYDDDEVYEFPGGGVDQILAGISYRLRPGVDVEVLTTNDTTGSLAIDLTGNELDNELRGNAGDNLLDGGAGADTLSGKAGDDRFVVDNVDDVVEELVGQGFDTILTSVSYVLANASEIEVLRVGDPSSIHPIELTGNEFPNLIVGNAGSNVLTGGGGGDRLLGLAGDDTYFIGDRWDLVEEAPGEGLDRVLASVSYTLSAGQDVETLSTDFSLGTKRIDLTGNEIDNTIIGNAAANILDGGRGSDTLWGLDGEDWYIVGDATDVVRENAVGGGFDRVFASVGYRLTPGSGVELLTTDFNDGAAPIALFGNELPNAIFGNAGSNVIGGGGGNDTLVGLAGADVFVFDTTPSIANVASVLDFNSGIDRLSLSPAAFDTLLAGSLDAGAFAERATAQSQNERILYDMTTGMLRYDPDGDGPAFAVVFAQFYADTELLFSDIFVA